MNKLDSEIASYGISYEDIDVYDYDDMEVECDE